MVHRRHVDDRLTALDELGHVHAAVDHGGHVLVATTGWHLLLHLRDLQQWSAAAAPDVRARVRRHLAAAVVGRAEYDVEERAVT